MICRWLVLPACVALLAAGDPAWRDKKIAEWTEEDARHILDDSPWTRSVTPMIDSASTGQRRTGMGRGGSIGIGIPGMGGGRRGGMGSGYPGGRPASAGSTPPTLKLRWESALPIREAELKARESNAPDVDEGHYAIAVYGVPSHMLSGGEKALSNDLKKRAAIKRAGKKDLKPSSVEILQRDDGAVILYSFPRSVEITRNDGTLEFQAEIGNLKLTQQFALDQMIFQGHLEL
jgi:hypothetical protein